MQAKNMYLVSKIHRLDKLESLEIKKMFYFVEQNK